MKMTQAWGWLVAAVLAAGLNASYHNGGLQWAHQIVDRVEQRSAPVLALATGRADLFLAEARALTADNEIPRNDTPSIEIPDIEVATNQAASCRFATRLARVRSQIGHPETRWNRFDVMSAREEAQLAKLEANRIRMEAQIAAQTARIRVATTAFSPVTVRAISAPVVCPRVRVAVPKIRVQRIPEIHIETGSSGPV